MIVPRRLANRSPQTAQPPEGGLTPALGLSTCVSRACRIWGELDRRTFPPHTGP